MRLLLRLLVLAAISVGAAGWFASEPEALPEGWADGLVGDATAGELFFAAGGCAACHAAPDASEAQSPLLSGGISIVSDFGTFYAPNISPHPTQGIGDWTFEQFARAMTRGVSPDGLHYYPVFPYTSYTLANPQDIADLFAYLRTLPADATPSRTHDVPFPFSIRRGIGIWKAVYMPQGFTVSGDLTAEELRGRYIAEALGHCAECHTPRDAIGGLDRDRWMKGAPDPSGPGRIPGITRSDLDWSKDDLIAYFTTGFTPEYDTAGGDMAKVIKALAKLPEEDRAALAEYIVSLP